MSKALATKQVAAVLLGAAMVLGFTFALATPAKAQTVAQLQAEIQSLLAQIASLQGGSTTTTTTTGGACFTFTQNLKQGSTGPEVMQLQKFLNSHGAQVAATGAGSPGNETSFFGPATKRAVIAWQNANAATVLTPVGLKAGTGYWGPSSRAGANAQCTSTGSTTTTTTSGTTTPTGPGITVASATQPANSLAPENATRVPFTTFTLTNNSSAAVTINGITVQRSGLASDSAFAGVILLDQNGLQLGNPQTFNANDQATIGGTFTLNPGQSMTYTVAGNMAADEASYAGQVASISVTGVNTSAPVTGSLPITGAQQTINASLSIGTATLGLSGYDPNGARSESIGTTGLTFSAVRITAGSAEDEKLYSITWNQTGSAGSTDLSNLATVVNGTSYPITVDSSGKYYTSTFPGGITITKGNSVDAYIKGDITGSSASGRTVEFDIYRSSDIYLVGQTYGYGIAPSAASSGTNTTGANTSSGFQASANPIYFGTYVTVTGGTLSTVSSASTVAPGNVAVNTPNQTLGGFSTNFTGEPVTVQSVIVDVATSSGMEGIQNATLVDQNGTVVAGPVDEVYVGNGSGTITFNTTVTFPTGPMTYTIEGTVMSGSTNGATVTLSTNPYSDWTSAVGQTSGSNVTLTNTTITMSTMTVQPGSLTISSSASPAATTVTTNQNAFTVANIVLDASQSGEDVRLSSLPVMVSATGTDNTNTSNAYDLQSNLTGCQLFNNGTALNGNAIGSSNWTAKTNFAHAGGQLSVDGIEANFIFTNPLTVAKGTTVTLALECNVGGSLLTGEEFAGGVDTSYAPTVTGATSGNTITPTVNSGTSGTMTVGTPTLEATVPTQPTYQQVAGGTTGVTIGTFTLQPTSGTVSLQNIALELDTNYASSSDLVNGSATIWQGTTQVGSVNFTGKSVTNTHYLVATSTISNVNLAQNAQTSFTIKADVSNIGTGESGGSNHELLIGLAQAQGTSGNTSVYSGAATQPGTSNGTAIFKSAPSQVSLVSLPATGNADGQFLEFSVTANQGGPVGIDQLVFSFASSTNVTISNPQLYYNTSGGTPTTLVANGVNGATAYVSNAQGNYATTTLATPLEIPAGATWNFLLKGSLTYSGSASTYSITTTLNGDSTNVTPNMLTGATATSTYDFVWSPNSTTTSIGVSNDWTNGYGVNGLPSFGISQTRSN